MEKSRRWIFAHPCFVVMCRKAASSPCLRPGSTLALRGRGFHPALDQGDAHAPLEPQHKVPRPNGRGLNGGSHVQCADQHGTRKMAIPAMANRIICVKIASASLAPAPKTFSFLPSDVRKSPTC